MTRATHAPHPVSLAVLAALLAVAACEPPPDEAVDTEELSSVALGAYYVGQSVHFEVYSAHATRVEVWLYSTALGAGQKGKVTLTHSGDRWYANVPLSTIQGWGITGTIYYGYRAWGPNWTYSSSWSPGSSAGFVTDVDAQGNRFNPNKLLFDPYALELSHDPINMAHTDGTVFASGPSYRLLDSGPYAPKGIVMTEPGIYSGSKPTRAFKDEVIYEVHVRGLTKNDTSIASAYRGTYRGAGLKAAALASLGITAVEFLPVQETDNDANDYDPSTTTGDNYWGYMTLNYFAPDRRYAYNKAPGGPTAEFIQMVNAFHAQGIKVYIDVVYNHTGEGGVWGTDKRVMNVMSFRGLDNQNYYSLTADRQFPWDNTGVGGNFQTHNQPARGVVIDSLRYWSERLGVDGFRFDLASVLGDTCTHGCFNFDKMDSQNALNQITQQLPVRPAGGGSGIDLIAEPWAIGGNSYQVGGFPSGWAEWNGKFRDVLRADQNQMGVEAITPGQLASRFAGSSDLYQDDGRKPYHSVNFMVAHDGFTMKDLYSCNSKYNTQAWPYGPSDGGEDNNRSWDQGGAGADQRRAARNGMSALMLSAGVPMFTGGDEFLRTQYCNNNTYNLDSWANWLGYSWSSDQSTFRTFTQRLIAFRKAHPALRPSNFYSSSDTNGNVMEQLRWFTPAGVVPDSAYWASSSNHAIAWRIDGTEFGDSAAAIYVAYNGWSGSVNFALPWPGSGRNWYRVTDTCNWAEGTNQFANPGSEAYIGGEWTNYGLCGRGLLLLIAK